MTKKTLSFINENISHYLGYEKMCKEYCLKCEQNKFNINYKTNCGDKQVVKCLTNYVKEGKWL